MRENSSVILRHVLSDLYVSLVYYYVKIYNNTQKYTDRAVDHIKGTTDLG